MNIYLEWKRKSQQITPCPWLLQAIQYKLEEKEAKILTKAVITSDFCKPCKNIWPCEYFAWALERLLPMRSHLPCDQSLPNEWAGASVYIGSSKTTFSTSFQLNIQWCHSGTWDQPWWDIYTTEIGKCCTLGLSHFQKNQFLNICQHNAESTSIDSKNVNPVLVLGTKFPSLATTAGLLRIKVIIRLSIRSREISLGQWSQSLPSVHWPLIPLYPLHALTSSAPHPPKSKNSRVRIHE